MNFKAITGTYEQMMAKQDELIAKNKIALDNGIPQIYWNMINNDLWTLVWMSVAPKTRRQPSLKKMNAKASEYNLHVQPCDDGFEITYNVGRYTQVAFAATLIGIQRKLAKAINNIQLQLAEKAIIAALPYEEVVRRYCNNEL